MQCMKIKINLQILFLHLYQLESQTKKITQMTILYRILNTENNLFDTSIESHCFI